MADRAFITYPDQRTDALLARAEAAISRSVQVAAMLDNASRRLADAIRLCDDLARIPATATTVRP